MALTIKHKKMLKMKIASIFDSARAGTAGRDHLNEVFELIGMSEANLKVLIRAFWLELKARMETQSQASTETAANLDQQVIDLDPGP